MNQVRHHTHFGSFSLHEPDLENAQTMHHEIQECAATQDPDSRVPTTHMMTKRVRCHTPAKAGFLTPRNPHPKNLQTRPGRNMGVCTATQDLNPRISPTPTMMNQVLSPSTKPNLENAQTTHHETQECAATQDPDSQVPTTHMTTKQVRCHTPASADFLTPQNPCPKNPRTRPGRNTGMCAATKTLTLDYSQPIQRGDLKYGATHPPKRPLPLATLHKELEGPHPSKSQSFSGINTVIIVPRGPPGFFNPVLYPAAFTPVFPFEISHSSFWLKIGRTLAKMMT
ncbi:hypothetical protein BS47DRAFT_1367759 [Hydnum rufescens UP504]|uniref:Uncharacterized protein n=1 Tax=Hydnum rufescens UP504 TaxID=1448309 RepID=A0A9P6AJ94_9AGAM|nr:hypothetical protein BS47DRAFT_1367759 [Hydnum rufescens UP504]